MQWIRDCYPKKSFLLPETNLWALPTIKCKDKIFDYSKLLTSPIIKCLFPLFTLPSSNLSLSNFRASMVEKFFMDRYSKDEPTAKNLVLKKDSSHYKEKIEKPLWGRGIHPPPPPLGHRRVKNLLS